MFNCNLRSSITHINPNKVFKCFKEVLNEFIVCFNYVILILLTTDEFKTCTKHVEKPCSDVYALWDIRSRQVSFRQADI